MKKQDGIFKTFGVLNPRRLLDQCRGGCGPLTCEEPRVPTTRTYRWFPASPTRRKREDEGLPGAQSLQLQVLGRTQVFARKKNEDTSVKRYCRVRPREECTPAFRDSAGPSATHLLTELRQQQHPERKATAGFHRSVPRGFTGLSSVV